MGKLIYTGSQIDEAIKKVKDGEKDVSEVTATSNDLRLGKKIVDKNKVEVNGTIGNASLSPSATISSRYVSDDLSNYPISITPKVVVNQRGIVNKDSSASGKTYYIQTEEKEIEPVGQEQIITPTNGKLISKATIKKIPDVVEYPMDGFPFPYFYYYISKSTSSSAFDLCRFTSGTLANNIYVKSGVSMDDANVYLIPVNPSYSGSFPGTAYIIDSTTHRLNPNAIVLKPGDSFTSVGSDYAPAGVLTYTSQGRITFSFTSDFDALGSTGTQFVLLLLYNGTQNYGVVLDAEKWSVGTQRIGTMVRGYTRRYSDRGCVGNGNSIADGVSSYNLIAPGCLMSNYAPLFFIWSYSSSSSYQLGMMTHGGGTKYYIATETKKLDEPVVSITSAGVASWEAVTGATTYYISITGKASYTVSVSSTSYNLRNKITTGGTYYVKVQARGSGIASDYSEPITYVLSLASPDISLNQNTLSWDAVTDATSYYVYKNGTQWFTTSSTSVNLANYSLAGGTYSITVKAYKSGWDLSEASNAITYKRLDAPELVVSSAGILSWSSISGASTYKVYIDDVYIRDTSVCLFDLNDYIDIDESHDIDVSAHGNSGEFSDKSRVSTFATYTATVERLDAATITANLSTNHVSVTEQSYSKEQGDNAPFNVSNLVSIKGCDYKYTGQKWFRVTDAEGNVLTTVTPTASSPYVFTQNGCLIYAYSTPSAECLGYYTQVEMADGTFKNLGDIEVGDEVLSIDFNTMKLVSRKVIYSGRDEPDYDQWIVPFYTQNIYEDGTVVNQCMRHRLYNLEEKCYKHLYDWSLGMHGYKRDGSNPRLLAQKIINEPMHYARITLEDSNNWFAEGMSTGDSECPTDITLDHELSR